MPVATLPSVAADVHASVAELTQAEAAAAACADALGFVFSHVAAVGLRGSADATATVRTEVAEFAAAVAHARARGERLHVRVLAIGETASSGAAPAPTAPATRTAGGDKQHDVLARKVDLVLIDNGIDPKDAYGDHKPDSPQRIRLATSLLKNQFHKRVRNELQAWALRFAARQGRPGDLATFTRRYEYAKAVFDDEKRLVEREVGKGTVQLEANQSVKSLAAERALGQDLDAQFTADTKAARRLTGQTVLVNTTAPLADQATAVQDAARRVGFTDEAAAAYHARKHNHELPQDERTSDVITGYHHSARRTIGEGACANTETAEQGRARLVFSRTASRPDGRDTTMNAVVYVQPTGQAVLATYGQMKGGPS